jgi:hypothetical protein
MYNRQQQPNGVPLPPILEEQVSFPISQIVIALREGKTIKVALKTKDGYFLSAVNGGGGSVIADAIQIGPNEIFLLIPQGTNRDKIAIRTANRNYISAINGGGDRVDARSTTLGSNELFNLIAIRPDQASFTTERGFYLLTFDTEPRLLTGYGVVQGPRSIYTIIPQVQ